MSVFKLVPVWVWAVIVAVAALFIQHSMLETARSERDQFEQAATSAKAAVDSLQETARLQRQLTADTEKRASDYDEELKNANAERATLTAGLADATYRLQVRAHWVSAARKPSTDVGTAVESDGGSCRLDPAAERAYPSLAAGIKTQRAQIIGLQGYVRDLLKVCKISP